MASNTKTLVLKNVGAKTCEQRKKIVFVIFDKKINKLFALKKLRG